MTTIIKIKKVTIKELIKNNSSFEDEFFSIFMLAIYFRNKYFWHKPQNADILMKTYNETNIDDATFALAKEIIIIVKKEQARLQSLKERKRK